MTSYQYPPAGQMPAQAPQQPYPQYAQQQPQGAPPSNGGMPGWHEANDEQARQAYATAAASVGNFGPNPQFLKIPGPRGQLVWDNSVPQGYSANCVIRVMPPWAQGKTVFVESKTIFYKSHKYPRGRVLGYQGEDSLFMQAIQRAADSGDERLQRVAADYGRVRTQYLYNVIDLSHPDSHTGQDGVMRPYLLGAGRQLHRDIGDLVEARGGINRIVSPVAGRPVRYTKTKTGPEPMNVEYGVIDLEPQELHSYFHPILQNLWDLEAQIPVPTQDDVLEAIRELGLPDPRQTMAQVPGQMAGAPPQSYGMSYQPDPNPPHGSPYQAQAAPPQTWAQQPPGPPQQPAGAPPAPVPFAESQMQQQPAQGGWGAPVNPAAMGQPAAPPPAQGAPPQQWAGAAAPPPPAMPPAQQQAQQWGGTAAPPPMPTQQPPPVTSGQALPGGYQPAPGGPPNPL
ncbi:MAG: hypothetical protein JSU89_15805 [Myxococcales bacterium]|nr:MAG: hypothetical protein JSU89_15805 [Myxococcales bacterium]